MNWQKWEQPSLIVSIVALIIAGSVQYVNWAIDRKMAAHELESNHATMLRFEEFREFEKRIEVSLAEIRLRLNELAKSGRNGDRTTENGALPLFRSK